MFSERVQVLMTKAQRRDLETEARERGTSVGALIREAVDARQRSFPLERRHRAAREIAAMRGHPTPSVDEIERIVDDEREEWIERLGGVKKQPRKR